MRIAIVQFPGSNCERETKLAVKRAGMEPEEFLWNESLEKLRDMAGFVIVGGFSYEDRSRAGIIAALDPIMQEIAAQSAKGKPVLGICNGAQILVETGLVPGLENNKVAMSLTENKRMAHGKILGTGYYNAWVHLRLSDQYQRNAFTRHLTRKDRLPIPVAHGEGRFVMTEALLSEIENQGLNVFQYCDTDGNIIDNFPVNPNGSLKNIAAISNKAGNVLAIMPHPERSPSGDVIFKSMRDYIASGRVEKTSSLDYYPRPLTPPVFKKSPTSHEWIIELIITDNQAKTVQTTLGQLGISVTVDRAIHWEIESDSETLAAIKKSGVLFNERKERMWNEQYSHRHGKESVALETTVSFLVRPRDDVIGQQKLQTLKDHFSLFGIKAIHYGVLWQFRGEFAKLPDLTNQILHTNIICNPYAYECYQYQSK